MIINYINKFKNILATLLAIFLLIATVLSSGSIKTEASGSDIPQTLYRSKEEIIDYIQNHPIDYDMPFAYKDQPVMSEPYAEGSLTDETYRNYINAINQVRFVAGLNEVTLDDGYNDAAQTAALINAINDELSHHPNTPQGMDTSMYLYGAEAATKSNLAKGFDGPVQAVILGWMHDSDLYNIDVVGHRRWILNPGMQKTGYGQVGAYSAMYAHDEARIYELREVAWPAKNMPVNLFDGAPAWSYTLGRSITNSEINDIKVVLKNTRNDKQWVFTKDSDNFYIDNGNYGNRGAIIFLPEGVEAYADGDVYSVTITGLANETIEYTVHFFDVGDKKYNPVESVSLEKQEVQLEVGDQVTLRASFQPVNATDRSISWGYYPDSICDYKFNYSTLNPSVTITAQKNGTTELTLTAADDKTFTCTIHVGQESSEPITPAPEEPIIVIPEEPTPSEPDEPTPETPDEPAPSTPDDSSPSIPDEPGTVTPVDPSSDETDVILNGIARGKDGKLALYFDGEVQIAYTGFADDGEDFWYVENGYVDESRNDILPDGSNLWWKVKNGKVDFDYTGVAKNKYGWWRVENGCVNFNANGIYKNDYGWWKVEDGKVNFNYTGVAKNDFGWWRVEKGKVNFKANGVFKNEYGWWKVEKGKVNFKYTGVAKNDYGWWRIEKGKVNFKFNGIAKNEYGQWYIKNGKVDFNKNGKVKYNGKTYRVTDGKAKLA